MFLKNDALQNEKDFIKRCKPHSKQIEDYIESFIKGSEMGIESSSTLLSKYEDADNKIKKIAQNLQTIELDNIDKLKDYLKRTDYL